ALRTTALFPLSLHDALPIFTVSLAADVQWKLFYGYVNGNVLFPLTTVTGSAAWLAFAIAGGVSVPLVKGARWHADMFGQVLPLRSEEHTSELQSLRHLVCRL